MTKRRSALALAALFAGLTTAALLAYAGTGKARELGGQIKAEVNGRSIQFPVLKSVISADIQGDLATVTVVQTFANPTAQALNASYLFPLNKDAAVYAMQMEVGDEIVTAKIKEKAEAKATFDKAKRQGRAAALLQQHRPNMFTQDLANLMPGLPVKITLKYTQSVPRIDGAYELVVPLIVGPRYQPPQKSIAHLVAARPSDLRNDEQQKQPKADEEPFGLWELQELPKYPEVAGLTIPDTIDMKRVSIKVTLNSGLAINDVKSATHAIALNGDGNVQQITLAEGRAIDNRDFVLRYKLAGHRTNAGLLAHKDKRGGFFSLMIEPPELPKADEITPRELVFVLDTSGSMSGKPIAASKTFMRHALRHLRPGDYFRIVRFANTASEFSVRPVPATPGNLNAGLSFVNGLGAGGGTNVASSITRAFGVPQTAGTMRIVVFLSDGYIGNEAQILHQIAGTIGRARIYAFGVGSSVNRYLLAEMARKGRGFARFIDPTESSDEAAVALAQRLETPVLTDISIDWGTLKPRQVAPEVIPDLFKGDSLRIQGRFDHGGTYEIAVEGVVNGTKARLALKVVLPSKDTGPAGAAIPLIWARTMIGDAMRDYTAPARMRRSGLSNGDLKQKVTNLGLAYSLTTRWTSFVAVSKAIVNQDPAGAKTADVPLPMVKGVTRFAYPSKQRAAFRPTAGKRFSLNFSGSSAPEPDIIGGLVVLALAGMLAQRRRRRRQLKCPAAEVA